MINVLIVDDSRVARDFLSAIMSADPAVRVVGTAVNGKEAVQAVKDLRPDVVMMEVTGHEHIHGSFELMGAAVAAAAVAGHCGRCVSR